MNGPSRSAHLTRRDVLLFAAGLGSGVLLAGLAPYAWHAGLYEHTALAPELNRSIDIGYVQSMLQHHNQALVMSSLIEKDASVPVAELARRIQLAQKSEIEQMTGWLIALEAPALPASGDWMLWMRQSDRLLNINEHLYLERCASTPSGMEGLATQAQLSRLSDKTLPARDREALYLQLMIKHHQGAVAMSTLPARHAATRFVRHLSAHVIQSQSNETGVMNRLLLEYQRS